jgi:hypothetical protein
VGEHGRSHRIRRAQKAPEFGPLGGGPARRGLARALTSVVERRAAELGLGCVRLSVRRALPRNRAMYLHFGYRHFGTGEAAGCPSAASEMLEKHLRAACRIRQQH